MDRTVSGTYYLIPCATIVALLTFCLSVDSKAQDTEPKLHEEQAHEGQPQKEQPVAQETSVEQQDTTDFPVEQQVEEQPVIEESQAKDEKASDDESWTDRIEFMGDFRYRFELIDTDGTDLRYRHRIRARPGILAHVVKDWDVGVKLGTGNIDDPVSNNQTLTNAFASKPIWLDLAYFHFYPSFLPGINLRAGKMKNPFYKVGKSELLWDPDLNPEGMALSYKRTFGMVEPFIHATGFFVEERKQDDDSWILGAQGGLKLIFLGGGLYVLAGGGYIDYTAIKGNNVFFDSKDSSGNSSVSLEEEDPDEEEDPTLIYKYDYNLIESFAEFGGKIAKFPWSVFGSTVVNTAVSNDSFGWLVGASFGKCKESLDFKLRYIYRQMEKDATVGRFTDSDFVGGGTNGKGHEWNLEFQIVKHVKAAVTYFYNQTPIEDSQDFHRAQIDMKLKF